MEKATREKLAKIAKDMAQVPFHGDVDGMASNLAPIVRLFPTWNLKELTGYGVRRLSIIAAWQRDSKSRTDQRNVKPVIWLHALAGRSLP